MPFSQYGDQTGYIKICLVESRLLYGYSHMKTGCKDQCSEKHSVKYENTPKTIICENFPKDIPNILGNAWKNRKLSENCENVFNSDF